MFMIVLYHLILHGVNGAVVQFFSWQPLAVPIPESFLLVICSVAVDCYVIISGYYGIHIYENNRIKADHILKIWIPMFIYSMLFATIAFARGKIGITEYLTNLFPVIKSNWWFATCYFILLFISPILNKIAENFYNSKYFVAIVGITILVTFIFEGNKFENLIGLGSNSFSNICILYIVGRMLRLNEDSKVLPFAKNNILLVILILVLYLALFLLILIGLHLIHRNIYFRISRYSCPVIILISISIFLLFRNAKVKHNKIINMFGSASFDVYLIHENLYVRKPLYEIVNSPLSLSVGGKCIAKLIPYLILASICIFLVCEMIGISRVKLVDLLRRKKIIQKNV